jgi:hypothetical protein
LPRHLSLLIKMLNNISMKPCVRAQVMVRKIQRHPFTRNSVRLQKYMAKGVTFGVLPSGINDVVFHHAPITVDEAMHVIIDQACISSFSMILAIAIVASRSLSD